MITSRRVLALLASLSALLLTLLPLAAGATSAVPAPSGTPVTIANGPGDQTDPHVSGDWVVYTDFADGPGRIDYANLSTNAQGEIADSSVNDSLSDVSGSTIVFVHFGADGRHAIYAADLATGAAPVELDPQPNSNRREASIGGRIVAWQDFGYSAVSSPEIVVYDLDTQQFTRLTNDTLYDRDPQVSPDGSTVVWTKCTSVAGGCQLWQAKLGGGNWTVSQLVTSPGDASLPDSNGALVVYGTGNPNDQNGQDIAWQGGDGVEHRLDLAGLDQNPNISGNVIAFEHYDAAAATPNFDIYLYDLSTATLYQLTNTPEDESLNDISQAADGTLHVVWSRRDVTGDDNVYGETLRLPSAGDTTPPTLQLPAPIVVNATSPAGATVTYGAYATDDSGSAPTVSCKTASGSTFAIGTTTVNCVATDASGNQATGSFTVQVKGAGDQLSDLIGLVQSFNLKQGITNSLDVKLQNAQGALNAARSGDRPSACNLLGAFTNEVQAQSGKALTTAQANQLLAAAQQIAVVLGCS